MNALWCTAPKPVARCNRYDHFVRNCLRVGVRVEDVNPHALHTGTKQVSMRRSYVADSISSTAPPQWTVHRGSVVFDWTVDRRCGLVADCLLSRLGGPGGYGARQRRSCTVLSGLHRNRSA